MTKSSNLTNNFTYLGTTILCENKPNPGCSHCRGTGYTGIKAYPSEALKIRPNDKCLCGSKKKYKHCCMFLVEENRAVGQIISCKCVGKVALKK